MRKNCWSHKGAFQTGRRERRKYSYNARICAKQRRIGEHVRIESQNKAPQSLGGWRRVGTTGGKDARETSSFSSFEGEGLKQGPQTDPARQRKLEGETTEVMDGFTGAAQCHQPSIHLFFHNPSESDRLHSSLFAFFFFFFLPLPLPLV